MPGFSAQGKLMSGRCGGYDYYVVKGKQCWRRRAVPKDPRIPARRHSRARFAAASKMWNEGGPLPGQQNYIGRNYTRKRAIRNCSCTRPQREQKRANNKELRPELTAQSRNPSQLRDQRQGLAGHTRCLRRLFAA